MGLDIYFNKLKPESRCKSNEDIDVDKDLDEIKDKNGKNIGYFRKVNFLLPFFDYGDNCSLTRLCRGDIRMLRAACEEVLGEHALAKEILPTQEGFFFGSTEYDDDYFEDVFKVYRRCGMFLEDLTEDDVIIMYCWW